METVLQKLNDLGNDERIWGSWTLEEKRMLLELYSLISRRETIIMDMIHRYRRSDKWAHIFREYDRNLIHDKADGVRDTIEYINEKYFTPSFSSSSSSSSSSPSPSSISQKGKET